MKEIHEKKKKFNNLEFNKRSRNHFTFIRVSFCDAIFFTILI